MAQGETRYSIANNTNSLDEPIYLPITNYWQKKHSRILGLTFVRYLNIKTPSCRIHLRNYVPASIHPTYGDGNCLFRCFSLAITGSVAFHETLRKTIADHITRNGRALSVLFPECFQNNPSNYLSHTRMTQRGTWGSDVEIMAAAHLLRTKIFVYTIHGDAWQWVEHNLDLTSPATRIHRQSIYLMHTSLVHYDLVKGVKLKQQVTWDRAPNPGKDQYFCRAGTGGRSHDTYDRRFKCNITNSASRNRAYYRSCRYKPRSWEGENPIIKRSTMHKNYCRSCRYKPRSWEGENPVIKRSTMHKNYCARKARNRSRSKFVARNDRIRKLKLKPLRKSLKRKLV